MLFVNFLHVAVYVVMIEHLASYKHATLSTCLKTSGHCILFAMAIIIVVVIDVTHLLNS